LTSEPGPGSQAAGQGVQRAVFLSYASEDAAAAQKICTALRTAGVEVWFDQSELRGGDSWDAMIRRQIKTCALFIPIISANSHARAEGYFRLEWKLAVDRSHLIAADRAFLVPVVIDGTPEHDERIPERFRDIQWTHLTAGETPHAFTERVVRLLAAAEPARGVTHASRAGAAPAAPAPAGAVVPGAAQPAVSAIAPARKWWTRPPLLLAAALIAALILGSGWFVGHRLGRPAAVVPYSAEDRRMTFAVLPFTAAADDARAQQIAKATNEAVTAYMESRTLFTHVASSRSVEEAAAHLTSPKALAKALDVHFLIRGTVAKDGTKDAVNLLVVDGATERVLGTGTLHIEAGALLPRFRDDLADPVRHLIAAGMEAEVKREAATPVDQLDVRALSFRALSSWRAHHGAEAKLGYNSATQLLSRALALAPDDPAATYLTANINLCDCVLAWSPNPEVQKAIGAAALEKYLQIDPNDAEMLVDKAELFQLRGRYEDSLVVLDQILQRDPDDSDALGTKAVSLLRLGRAKEALGIAQSLVARYPTQWAWLVGLEADVQYTLGDYPAAVQLARNAMPRMSEEELKSPVNAIQLTLAAAEARVGQLDAAKATLADFNAVVPNVTTIAQMKQWIHPTADLHGFEPLFAGLRMAGVKD
jgi:tetratricopeptide (TPR) repeat protein/TolB-like protein